MRGEAEGRGGEEGSSVRVLAYLNNGGDGCRGRREREGKRRAGRKGVGMLEVLRWWVRDEAEGKERRGEKGEGDGRLKQRREVRRGEESFSLTPIYKV